MTLNRLSMRLTMNPSIDASALKNLNYSKKMYYVRHPHLEGRNKEASTKRVTFMEKGSSIL